MFRGPGSVLFWFPSCQSGVHEFPLAQVGCFCGFHQHGLDPFVHPSSLSTKGSQEISSVLSCESQLLLLDEGSRMAFKVVINLIIGDGHLR